MCALSQVESLRFKRVEATPTATCNRVSDRLVNTNRCVPSHFEGAVVAEIGEVGLMLVSGGLRVVESNRCPCVASQRKFRGCYKAVIDLALEPANRGVVILA